MPSRKETIEQIVGELKMWLAEYLDTNTRTCLNCVHFNIENEGCRLAQDSRPPAEIIITGCEKHEDEIPF